MPPPSASRTPRALDWAKPLPPEPGDERVFWGCGLSALLGAALTACISHAAGAMLVTDLPQS
ncbi:D-glutamate cyclase family protein [Falsiroseomonas sp.]|uniref:D-glutamate cyclase family protein n=1 Tax=Falsiroseomonas sp. TaxID=2870721 RepID=UPI003564FA36